MSQNEQIINQMTLEEKAALCTGAGPWNTTPIPRLGIPGLFMTDGPHGLRKSSEPGQMAAKSLPATCYPTASCLASTWDKDLLSEMGQALADECIAQSVDILLGPGVNMKRSPLGGRNFEYFSEDPYLAGELAASLIKGIQSRGVGTSLKHFAANNQEYRRFSINAEVDERTLREIYLPAFEKAVKEAKPWTVMCAYNKLNGDYCSENSWLLNHILKEEWGFEGFVVSDWGAVHNRVRSLDGGLDLEMPGPQQLRTQAVIDAVRSGELAEAELDETVRRILRIAFMAAETPKGSTSFNPDDHHALARKIASEGMVLLKNNGILPLKNIRHLAVIGKAAQVAQYQGGGSSHINPTRVDVPYQELQKLAGDAELAFAEGYSSDTELQPQLTEQAVQLAQTADAVVLFIALPASKESEGYDRPDMDLTPQQIALIRAVTASQQNTVVVLNNGSPVAMNEWIGGAAAVLESWMMGQAGGGAIADILFGRVNPSGKLAETFPLRLADTPAYLNWPGDHRQVHYGEGIYIGYRYYDARQVPVSFPFGFGLSYSTFEYSDARLSANRFKDNQGVSVSVDVTNTGSVLGKEIVQVYVSDHDSELHRPQKELKGFAKVELLPGETKTVQVNLDFRSFAYYHPIYKQWITEDGPVSILIGASSADIRFRLEAFLESTLELPTMLDRESTIRDWLNDPRGKQVFEPMFQNMVSQMGQAFAAGDDVNESIGMDLVGMIMDMPMESVLMFQSALLPMPAELIVENMLNQVRQIN